MKRVLSFLCAVAMVLTMCTFYMGETLSVAAEEIPADKIVKITTFEQLVTEMKNSANNGKTLQLQNDLAATAWKFEPADTENMTVSGSNGTNNVVISIKNDDTFNDILSGNTAGFSNKYAMTIASGVNIDGNGKAITGLMIRGTKTDNLFFISGVGPSNTVKNLVFKDSIIIAEGAPTATQKAAFFGNVQGKLINCKIEDDVTIAYRNTGTAAMTIAPLAHELNVTGTEAAISTLKDIYEGIQGKYKANTVAVVDGCINKATVLAYSTNSQAISAGGLVAIANGGGIVRNCSNYGDVTVAGGISNGVGGIMGLAEVGKNEQPMGYERNLSLINCANYGDITATDEKTGGIIGDLNCYWSTGGQANIALCYNMGTISSGDDKGIVGEFNAPEGTKFIEGASNAEGGYSYAARLNGGTALNFINSSATPYTTADKNTRVDYYTNMTAQSGSFSLSRIYSAPNNIYSKGFFDEKTKVVDILNLGVKYIEGLRPWVADENGNPHINLNGEKSGAVVVDSVTDLDELRNAVIAFENLGSQYEIKATLARDIDLNEGVTFGYDAAKKVGVVKKDDKTYYVGYGSNDRILGKFYTEVEGVLTETTAPELTEWSMFRSMLISQIPVAEKIKFTLDGAGNTIHGIYINSQTQGAAVGFASYANNFHFVNLTLDGLILSKGHVGGFIGLTHNDTTITDCVNNITVLANSVNQRYNVGGFVGYFGVGRSENWLFERMPDRICSVIGCTNNATIAAKSGAGEYPRFGGIVGGLWNGEVAYCTNTGNVSVDGYAYGATGVVGFMELGTNLNSSGGKFYGANTWSGNRCAPLQTIAKVYGNSNSGVVTATSGRVAGVVSIDASWAAHGAWGIVSSKPLAKLDSEYVVQYNVSYGTANSSINTGTSSGMVWSTPSVDLKLSGTYEDPNVVLDTGDARHNRTGALRNTFAVTSKYDKGYMMWIDYDYSNGGIPHAIKMPSREAYEGVSFGAATGYSDAVAKVTVTNAAGLQLLNETVNYITKQPVTIGGQIAKDIIAVHEIAYATDIAADGTVSSKDIDTKTSITNAINYYINTNLNGAKYNVTQFYGIRVHLGADIDLGGAEWLPLYNDVPYLSSADKSGLSPAYRFLGIFEGEGHTVSNFKFPRKDGVGFFGANGCKVLNVKFADLDLELGDYSAIACSYNHSILSDIVIEDTCKISTGRDVGAVCGWHYSGLIKSCVNYADVIANGKQVGGVVGTANSVLNGNKNYGNITSNVTGDVGVAGVVGATYASIQTATLDQVTYWNSDNVNYGNVTAVGNNVGGVYGLFKDNKTDKNFRIINAENYGNVTGADQTGGVIGKLDHIANDTTFSKVENAINHGTINGKNQTGGIIGYAIGPTIDGALNEGDVTSSGQRFAGIAGRISGTTVINCENTGTITSTGTNDIWFGAIVGNVIGTSTIKQNINRGTVNAPKARRSAGIVGAIDAGNTVVEGNVNYGSINGSGSSGGIVCWVNATNVLIKGNVNYGNIVSTSTDNGGILCQSGNPTTTVCYNVNYGTITEPDSVANQYTYSGSIVACFSYGKEFEALKANVYGNVDATGFKVIGSPRGSGNGFVANNYSLGLTSAATLIDGKAVTADNFKFGEVADIINHLSYPVEKFLSTSESYLYKTGSDEKVSPTGIKAGLTEGNYAATLGLEANYMVQTIGVDAYPIPKLAAAIIYADREITVPAGKLEVAPAAPATEGTEKFVGYIDYGRNLYNVGDTIAGGAYLYPITVDFYTAYGAGARTSTPTGIRFQTLVKADSLAMMNGELGAGNFGTIILPTSYVDAMMSDEGYNNKLDVQQIIANGVQRVDIVNNGWASAEYGAIIKDGYYTYMGSLVNILEANYARAFSGISYLKVEYADHEIAYITADWQTEKDGSNFVNGANYSKAANSREVRQIAFRALNDKTLDLSEAVRQTLEAYRGSYTE